MTIIRHDVPKKLFCDIMCNCTHFIFYSLFRVAFAKHKYKRIERITFALNQICTGRSYLTIPFILVFQPSNCRVKYEDIRDFDTYIRISITLDTY